MESDGRKATTPLAQWLEREGKEFSFVQAVRLLESLYCAASEIGGGDANMAGKEPVRFGAHASLSFPCTDIESIRSDGIGQHHRMTVNFFGLFGPASPLPPFYTMETIQNRDIRDFLDFFNHRLLSLFYRSCTKYRPYLRGTEGLEDFENILFSVMGLRDEALRPNGLEWKKLLPLAGLLSMRSHSASNISMVVSQYYDNIPVHIHEFVGRWVNIPNHRQARLGSPACQLINDSDLKQPESAVLGEKTADIAGKFRVVIGPIRFSQYLSFLSDHGRCHRHEKYGELFQLIRFLVRDQLDFDVELHTEEIPHMRLGSMACKLAQTTWLARSSDNHVQPGLRQNKKNAQKREHNWPKRFLNYPVPLIQRRERLVLDNSI